MLKKILEQCVYHSLYKYELCLEGFPQLSEEKISQVILCTHLPLQNTGTLFWLVGKDFFKKEARWPQEQKIPLNEPTFSRPSLTNDNSPWPSEEDVYLPILQLPRKKSVPLQGLKVEMFGNGILFFSGQVMGWSSALDNGRHFLFTAGYDPSFNEPNINADSHITSAKILRTK